ncbi:MAG: type II toxin-antitoxin system RelE/ParE family toxin [bacterium]|nr:type II toxin-antitoxin system RelE/ParE family toxin [bacterium]
MRELGKTSANNNSLRYHPAVVSHDIPLLDFEMGQRVRKVIENKLTTNPLLYGSPLHGILKKLFKIRVGDFRIIYAIEKSTVIILVIDHRKDVDRTAETRLN